MTAIPLTVEQNPWIACSLALTFFFSAPGLAWGWYWWPTDADEDRGARGSLLATALAAFVSLAVTLLAALALGEAGWLHRPGHAALIGVVAIAGLATGLGRAPDRCRAFLRAAAPGVGAMLLAFCIVMNLPHRGEWVLGGWDPGVYMNQGVQVARSGSFTSEPLPCFTDLTQEQFEVFARGGPTAYRELVPGVPAHPDDRSAVVYFFRLFPTLIATLAQSGGLRAATRVNDFMGVFALLAFAALLARARPGFWLPLGTLLLAAQPLWLYELHTPTSEMLHLYLVLAAGLFWLRRAQGARWNLGFSAALAIGILNRFDHLVFAALWIALTALADATREDRRRVLHERLLQVALVAAAGIADAALSPITLQRLHFVVPMLLVTAIALGLAASATDALCAVRRVRDAATRHALAAGRAAALLAVALFCALWSGRVPGFLGEAADTLRRVVPFIGRLPLAAALAGGLWMGCLRRREQLAPFVLFLAGCAAAMLIESNIVPIYPWAARRHVPFTLPAIALLGGFAFAQLAGAGGRARGPARALALLALCAILWDQRAVARDAWRHTEYDGVSARIAEVAAQIGPDDVVLADHPWWATPLMLLHGKQVLSGEELWDRPKPGAPETGQAALASLAARGRRIRLLTSTGGGLDVYPLPFEGAVLDWSIAPFVFREVQHHKSARGFAARERTREFRLYTWRPAAAAGAATSRKTSP